MLRKTSLLAAILISMLAATTRAELFELNAVGTTDTVNADGSSLPDLIDDLINTQSQFQTLDGQAYNASVKYGGVNDALLFNSNAAGTSTTLTIPSTGFTRTFTGATADDVRQQIEDFLLEDGAEEYARFLQAINEQSLLGVVDGNPRATTALMSDHAFRAFGLNRSPAARLDSTVNVSVASNFRFDFEGGVTDNDEADETFFTGAIGTGFVGENFGVTLTTIANYRDVDGSSLFSLGFELGVPIYLIPPKAGERSIAWQITPVGSVSGGASYDLAAGGTMWGIGITSALSYRADRWIFTLANHITHYEGFSLSVGEYEFETLVSQQVVKNGVGVAYLIGRGYVDASVSYTNFLQEAAIDGYLTPSVGFGIKFGQASGVHFAYKGDFDSDYTAHGGEVLLYFGF